MKLKLFFSKATLLFGIACFITPAAAYDNNDIEEFLPYNRTLVGDPYRVYPNKWLPAFLTVNIDHEFMVDLIRKEINGFNKLVDDYDDRFAPASGYTWDLKIFHPGETPGVLPSSSVQYPVIIINKGSTGSDPSNYDYMDWLAREYAAKGYVVAIPHFIHDWKVFFRMASTPFTDIRVDIYALQVSQTLDYLEEKFSESGLLNSDNTTVIGHSFGGYVALRAACHEQRISRIALLSAYYEQYLELDVMDTYDIMRYLNSLPDADKPALHVQRFTQSNRGCPDVDPECDPIPVVDGSLFLTNLSEDPWEPFLCDDKDCGKRTGTFYHYTLYNGPKEDGIRNNPYLTHSDGDVEAGYPEIIRHLDNFFAEFPVEVPADNSSVSLVETRSTPGFDPPVFFLELRSAD